MNASKQLDLKPGEWVEVRSEAEVLATLDECGALDNMPFMPEMLAYCGKRFQVFKRADKTCDTVTWSGMRRMHNTVHLKADRCNGSFHGGCQAGCLLFWNERWLKRSPEGNGHARGAEQLVSTNDSPTTRDRAWLEATTIRSPLAELPICYRCQATELKRASSPLPWWEPKQYVRDVCKNNASFYAALRTIVIAAYSKILWRLTGRRFPSVAGSLTRTPTTALNLQPGEWVRVKTKQEILATLDKRGRNRGLSFDIEMIPYCGRVFQVLRRVDRLIDEASGRMIEPVGVSIILENVVCLARYHRLCPRSIFPYWREIWLERVSTSAASQVSDCSSPSAVAAAEKNEANTCA